MPTTNYRSENCTHKNGSSVCWAENQSLESDRRLNASGRLIMRGSKTNHELDLPALRGCQNGLSASGRGLHLGQSSLPVANN